MLFFSRLVQGFKDCLLGLEGIVAVSAMYSRTSELRTPPPLPHRETRVFISLKCPLTLESSTSLKLLCCSLQFL